MAQPAAATGFPFERVEMTRQQKRPMPRRLEAYHLSDRGFPRAMQLPAEIRAANPGTPFKVARNKALRQAWIENREAPCGRHDAA